MRRENSSLKSDKNNVYCMWRLVYIYEISRWILIRMRILSDKCSTGNKNTLFVSRNIFFFRKSCHFWDNVGKYGRTGQATGDNIIRRVRIAWWITKDIYTFWPPPRWRYSPMRAMASSFLRFFDHKQRRTIVGRTTPDEWSARRRDLCLITHTHTHSHQPQAGFETTIPARPMCIYDNTLLCFT